MNVKTILGHIRHDCMASSVREVTVGLGELSDGESATDYLR